MTVPRPTIKGQQVGGGPIPGNPQPFPQITGILISLIGQCNYPPLEKLTSLLAQTVKRLPMMQETWVQSLDRADPLEKEMATHSSILAWKIPWTEEPGRLQSMGPQRVRHNWATSLTHKNWQLHTLGLLFSHSVMSDTFRPHELQHARLPYPSPSPGACSNLHPLSRWCHPTKYLILCLPFLFLPSIFPSIRVFSNELTQSASIPWCGSCLLRWSTLSVEYVSLFQINSLLSVTLKPFGFALGAMKSSSTIVLYVSA